MSDYYIKTKKINTISLVNQDALLSQFKHHFTILKVYLPRKTNLETFAEKVPQGFGIPSNFNNSVYIAQLVNVYEDDFVDIAIGFRRDQTAIMLTKRTPLQFRYENFVSEVQMSNGFKIFMEELRSQEMEQEKIKDDFSNLPQKLKNNPSNIFKNPKISQQQKPSSQPIQKQPQIQKDRQKQKQRHKRKISSSHSNSKSKSSSSRSRQKKKTQLGNRLSSVIQNNTRNNSNPHISRNFF